MTSRHDPARYQTKLWRLRRKQVLARAKWRCEECGRAGRLEAHHKVPISAGGTDDLGNLVALCRKCHFAKHACRHLQAERAEWDELIETYR